MQICSEEMFKQLVNETPGLCAWGMASESLRRFNKIFYSANKFLLLNSYSEFVICCTWLRGNCTSTKGVSAKSPTSRALQQMAKYPQYVGNGAMIAAVLYMGIPYRVDPYSPYVQVGISLNSACFRTSARRESQQPRLACQC